MSGVEKKYKTPIDVRVGLMLKYAPSKPHKGKWRGKNEKRKAKAMGKKMSMVALDKYEKRLSVDVRVFVKYENRAADAGISVAAVMNAVLDDAVAQDPWTREDEARARALIDQNFEKREAKKAKKGIR